MNEQEQKTVLIAQRRMGYGVAFVAFVLLMYVKLELAGGSGALWSPFAM